MSNTPRVRDGNVMFIEIGESVFDAHKIVGFHAIKDKRPEQTAVYFSGLDKPWEVNMTYKEFKSLLKKHEIWISPLGENVKPAAT
jgi:hypothetical protein